MSGSLRYHHLDNLRWSAMLMGVFVHALTVSDFGRLEVISFLSHMFRMPLFYMISGFLAAMLIERQGGQTFLRNRLRNICVPLLFGLVVLNPPTLQMIYLHFNGETATTRTLWLAATGQAEAEGQLVWHLHLWFLIPLALYACAAPLAMPAIVRLARLIETFFSTPGHLPGLATWTVILLTVSSITVIRIALNLIEVATGPLPWLVVATLTYLPFYATGMMLHSSSVLMAAAARAGPLSGAIAIGLYLAALAAPFSGLAGAVAEQVGLAIARCWICLALLYWGQKWFSAHNAVTDTLSRAIYTVYLLHYGLIYGLVVGLGGTIAFGGPIDYLALVVAVVAISLAIHAFIVSPSRILTYVMNGRLSNSK